MFTLKRLLVLNSLIVFLFALGCGGPSGQSLEELPEGESDPALVEDEATNPSAD